MNVVDAVRKSRLEGLKATRDALARSIDAGGGTVAQCVAQLRAVLLEIDELSPDVQQKGTGLSEFEQRLREREQAAKGPARAKRG